MENIVEGRDIKKAYDGHVALSGLNITVGRSHVHGLLGPNGAGKTTFLRILNQITRQDSGTLLFDGRPLEPRDVEAIGYLPEERGLYKKMRVGEQALYLARLKGMSRNDALKKLKYWFDRFEIGDWWGKKVEELSKGMQQKVQFIVTVLHEPRLLIFDEPFSGFDPVNANLLKQEILALRDRGATVLFSTHNMQSVEEICDAITLINNSRDVLSGTVGEVRKRYKENKFALRYAGSAKELETLAGPRKDASANTETAAQMEVLFLKEETDGTVSAEVRCPAQMLAHEVVRLLANGLHLIEVREMLPSMNDIFINVVAQNKR